jgi:hypothetical protein
VPPTDVDRCKPRLVVITSVSVLGGRSSIPEYARTEREKTARLRMLRLAREAALASKAEQTDGSVKTRTQHVSSKASQWRTL